MNYIDHYERLIERAKHRVLEGYAERHHIVPRCIGGDDSPLNMVRLTAEEHFVAHQLLIRLFPRNAKLAYAAIAMAKRVTGRRAYGWLRRKQIEAQRGRHHRSDAIAKMSAAKRSHWERGAYKDVQWDNKAKWTGKKHSAETRAKMSESMRAYCAKPGSHERRSETMRLEWQRRRASSYKNNVGRVHSPETRAKISASRLALFAERRA